jgi:hypothetical protein
MKLLFFLKFFANVYIYFRIWTRIRNPRVTDPDPRNSSGSTTLLIPTITRLKAIKD